MLQPDSLSYAMHVRFTEHAVKNRLLADVSIVRPGSFLRSASSVVIEDHGSGARRLPLKMPVLLFGTSPTTLVCSRGLGTETACAGETRNSPSLFQPAHERSCRIEIA
jgi:hypothetical protein